MRRGWLWKVRQGRLVEPAPVLPPVPFLQHTGAMPVAKGRVFRFTYLKQIRSSKTPVISAAFGSTGWCLPGLEGLFVTATYFLGKYPAWLVATFGSWRK